ncbi:MAG: histidine--tRNA ligase [Solirubrobacterales bacterium]
MPEKLQAPRGTFDVLPEDSARRDELVGAIAAPALGRAGYGRIETPIFEDTALFARGVGESTDVVQKEMYSFRDQGDRSLTLRPEGTAAVCRAYVEHGMHKLTQPVKLWYFGPFFRQEAPQAGRFRQFFQIGAEALGSDSPMVDAESIALLDSILRGAGVTGVRLRIGSLGSRDERLEYSERLKAYLRANESKLAKDVAGRIDLNPLRAFDSKDEATQAVIADAPRLMDAISADDRAHFDDVLALLDAAGVAYEVDTTLVRGLDYYTRTVFEFTADNLGAQSGVAGGGRYDGLVEMLGGPATPGIGWAAGVERIIASSNAEPPAAPASVFVGFEEGADIAAVFRLTTALRERTGDRTVVELAGRSIRSQLKYAAKIGARHTVIFGGDRGQYDAAVKDMDTGNQEELSGLTAETFIDAITGALQK